MRDRRDYLIAALAAALCLCLGLLVGQHVRILPEAAAQGASDGGGDQGGGDNAAQVPSATATRGSGQAPGITIQPPAPSPRPAGTGRTAAPAPSDSDSNNRFVAVTCPTNTGESVLFLIDALSEQIAVYRYRTGQGLEYLSGRKIEYDLKVTDYRDVSEHKYDDMRELYRKQVARQAAKAAGK